MAILCLLAAACGGQSGAEGGGASEAGGSEVAVTEAEGSEAGDETAPDGEAAVAECPGDGPITIGYLAPQSGPAAATGGDTIEGAQIAVQLANADGGVNGRDVQLEVRDSQFDPSVGAQVTREFASDDTIPLMVGSVETAVLKAQGPLADREQFPVVALVGDGPQGSAWVVHPFPKGANAMQNFGQYLVEEEGVESFAGIGWDDVGARGILEGLRTGATTAGAEWTGEQFVPIPATDMSGPIAQLRGGEPQGLAITAAGQTPGLVVRQASDAGWDVQMYGYGGYQGSREFWEVAGETAEGFRLIGIFAPDLASTDVTEPFVTAFEEEHGNTPTVFETAGFDSTYLAIEALRAVGCDREALNGWLHGEVQDFPVASGEITIDGETGGVIRDMFVQEWQDGELVGLDTVEDASVAPQG